MSEEKKVEFKVEKTNARNVVLIAKSDVGTTRTSIYLWPKELFDNKSYSTPISVNKTNKP